MADDLHHRRPGGEADAGGEEGAEERRRRRPRRILRPGSRRRGGGGRRRWGAWSGAAGGWAWWGSSSSSGSPAPPRRRARRTRRVVQGRGVAELIREGHARRARATLLPPLAGTSPVDYGSEEHASIVYKTLAVDKELQPDKLHPDKVRREMTISGGKLIVVFLHEVYDGQLVVRLKKGNNLPAMDPWSDDSDNSDDGSGEVSSSDEEEEVVCTQSELLNLQFCTYCSSMCYNNQSSPSLLLYTDLIWGEI